MKRYDSKIKTENQLMMMCGFSRKKAKEYANAICFLEKTLGIDAGKLSTFAIQCHIKGVCTKYDFSLLGDIHPAIPCRLARVMKVSVQDVFNMFANQKMTGEALLETLVSNQFKRWVM